MRPTYRGHEITWDAPDDPPKEDVVYLIDADVLMEAIRNLEERIERIEEASNL